MRCARSIACASTAGFHHGSSRNTYSAAVRLSPRPPALRLIRKSGHVGSVLEALDARGAVARPPVEVLVGRCRRASSRARSSARKLVNCEKTSALCPSSTTSPSRGSSTSNFADGSSRARADRSGRGWQAAWRSRSSASSICIFDSADAVCAPRARAASRGSARAARRRAGAAAPRARSGSSARCAPAAPARPAPSCGAG